VKSTAIFEYVYSIKIDDKILDRFIAKKYLIERSARKMKEKKLISELYRMNNFD
jgi:hypothetical protein